MDRLTEMEAFAAVVDQGGFTDAASTLGLSKSAVSKHVAALEARLGARLLNRTTRSVGPTEIGLAYYDRARRVLNDAGEADALVSAMQAEPAGLLRLACVTDFGVKYLPPILAGFRAAYPAVSLDVVLCQRRVDLVAEGYDLAIRPAPMPDSSLKGRRLLAAQMRLVASPAYLAAHGQPDTVNQLNDHNLIHTSKVSSRAAWTLLTPTGAQRHIRAKGGLCINDSQCQLEAAIAGVGIAYLPDYLFQDALAQGLVVDALPSLPLQPHDLHVVHPYQQFEQPKLRVFVDHLVHSVAALSQRPAIPDQATCAALMKKSSVG